MRLHRFTRHWLAALGACMAFGAHAADSAGSPTRPVQLIVSYAPGNVTDLLARIIAEQLAQKWGQPVTVDNRPGQGGSLGAQAAVRAANDGYTLLFSAMAAFAINPHVYSSVGYDPLKDFAPIVGVAYPEGVLAASLATPASTLPELVAYSKANPGALNYGSPGNGTVPQLNMELLKAQTGLVAQHVPYKAATASATDLIAGRIQLLQYTTSVLLPQIQDGKVKALASMTPERLKQLPDVPAIAEVVPGFEPVVPWLGILAPAGTPAAIVDKVYRDVGDILQQPAVREKLAINGMQVLDAPPARFGDMIKADYDRLGKLVAELDLKVD